LVVSSQLLVVSSQLLVVSGQLLVVSSQLLVVSGQLLVVSGQLSFGLWPLSRVLCSRVLCCLLGRNFRYLISDLKEETEKSRSEENRDLGKIEFRGKSSSEEKLRSEENEI